MQPAIEFIASLPPALPWMATVAIFTTLLCRMGVLSARLSGKLVIPVFVAAWLAMLFYVYAITHPVFESKLLQWPSYIYLRSGLFMLPAALFLGAFHKALPPSSARAVKLLFIFLAVVSIYDFRWGLELRTYPNAPFARDAYGICRPSCQETSGASACATALGFYNILINEKDLALLSFTRTYDGSSPLGLCHALQYLLERQGCKVELSKPNLAEIERLPVPSILMTERRATGTEAMVFLGMQDGLVMIGDPLRGLLGVPLEQFAPIWTGLVIKINPPKHLRENAGEDTWI